MKTDDIIPKKEQIGKVINYIMKQSPNDNKIIVHGEELIKKFNYEFLDKGLIVSIDYNIGVSPSQAFKVDEFWGDQIRIDIAGGTPKSKIKYSKLKDILTRAFDEYIEVVNRKSQSYEQL